MTRLVDFDTASFNVTDQRSTFLWGVFNNKDYKVKLDELFKYAHRSIGALAYRSGSNITISSGTDLTFESVLFDTGSFTNTSSTQCFVISDNRLTHVRVYGNLRTTLGRNTTFNITKNGVIVGSAGKWSRNVTASQWSMNFSSNQIPVSSGDIITFRMTAGSSISENNGSLKTWWSIIPERFS